MDSDFLYEPDRTAGEYACNFGTDGGADYRTSNRIDNICADSCADR